MSTIPGQDDATTSGRLARLWAEVLERDSIEPDDDFFALGGSSISAGQILSRVQAELGVDLTFRDIFDAPTLRELAAVVDGRRGSATGGDAPFGRAVPTQEYPLTHPQRRMWYLEQLHPGLPTYRMVTGLRLRGALRTDVLQAALGDIVARHSALRMTFHERDGVPVQVVQPAAGVPLPVVDLVAVPLDVREAAVRRLARDEARRPLDLRTGPLARATLLRFGEEDHVLLLMVHHLVFDAWSRVIVLRELGQIYQERVAGIAPGTGARGIDYVDYAVWQESAEQDGERARDLAYWREALGSEPPVLDLLPDHPRPPVPDFDGAREDVDLPAGLHERLKECAAREGATRAAVLLTAFAVLLRRHTGNDAMVVGLLVAGRGRRGADALVGLFVNELALRLDVAQGDTFRSLLSRTRQSMRDGLAHQDAPLDDVVRAVRAVRPMGNTPLFNVAFNYKPRRDGVLEFGPALTAAEVRFDTGATPFDITLEADVAGGALSCYLDYARELFEPKRMRRMAAHFRTLLEGLIHEPDRPVDDLPILGADEQAELLSWNDTRRDYPLARSIPQILEERVAAVPDAVAVVAEGQALTFDTLNRRANQLAHHLRSLGVGPDTIVGLVAERSPETVMAIYAILKAGGAYLPIDPEHPRERVVLVLDDARVPVVVGARRPHWSRDLGRVEMVWLDDGARAAGIGRESEANPVPVAGPESLAYVIYTSGSTGRPKGVLVSNRSVVNMWFGFRDAISGSCPDRPMRVSLDSALSFDASVEQVLCLLDGHTLHIAPEDVRVDPAAMVAYARRHALDVIDVVPTQMRLLLEAGLLAPGQRTPALVFVGGEAIDEATWQRLGEAEGVAAFNFYGPTECTVNATVARITSSRDRPNIGGPLANTQAHVLDAGLRQVPVGVAGELYLGGDGVACGYLNRPELTAERFVPDRFSGRPGSRLYRTGDRVRWIDGRLEFLGRTDGQVKLRGLRIELGEIDATLERHPSVQAAVTLVRGEGEKGQLVAVVVARDPSRPPQAAALRSFLKETLPGYMIPSALTVIDALPRTSGGKVDRRALLSRSFEGERLEAPGTRLAWTPTSKRLYEIWADLLSRREIELGDDFFDIGGHSLLAVRLMAEIEKAFGMRLPPAALVHAPTLTQLAALLEEKNPAPPSRAVALSEKGSGTPLFLVTPFHGDALMFRELSRALGSTQPVYSLQPTPIVGTQCRETVESAASEMVEAITRVQPLGPYQLAGYCIGGLIALEVANQLTARGQRIAFLGFLDSVRPGVRPIQVHGPGAPPAPSPARSAGETLEEGRRKLGKLRERARGFLLRVTFEFCRRTGMRQPGYLQDEGYLDGLVASLHRPRKFHGTGVLFRSAGIRNRPLPPGAGWAEYVSRVEEVDVAGDHIAILHVPDVGDLGEKIANALETARKAPR
jgi:amino acid adenylation domain-containing protein